MTKEKEDISLIESGINSEITLESIIKFLYKNIKILFFTPVCVSIISVVYAQFFFNYVYVSSAKIVSSSSGSSIGSVSNIAAQFGLNVSTPESNTVWVYPEILKSRNLALKVLEQKFQTEKFEGKKSLLQILTYGDEEPEYGLDTLKDIGTRKLLQMFTVSEDRINKINTLTVRSFEPQFSSDIISAYINQLDKHQKEFNKQKSSKTRQFIENRIDATQKELQVAEEKLTKFLNRNRKMQNSPSLLAEQQRLQREVQVLTGVFTTLKQQLETTKIEEVRDADYVIVVDDPYTPIWPVQSKRSVVIKFSFIGALLGLFFSFINQVIINSGFKVTPSKINEKLKEMLS